MASGRRWLGTRRAIEKRSGLARTAEKSLQVLAAVATLAVVGAGVINHFKAERRPLPGEGKRVIAFRQLADRICNEHRDNLKRALGESAPKVERLQFVARAIGWNLNDFEGITPPPSRIHFFSEELDLRKRSRAEILQLQRSIELGNQTVEGRAITELDSLRRESRELSRENGVNGCLEIVPPMRSLLSD